MAARDRADLRRAPRAGLDPLRVLHRPQDRLRRLEGDLPRPNEQAALDALERFEERWGRRYPAIGKLWREAWDRFVPMLDYPPEIRRVLYTTNMVESLNYQLRKITRNRRTPRHHLNATTSMTRPRTYTETLTPPAALGCDEHHDAYDQRGWVVTWIDHAPVIHHPDRPPDPDKVRAHRRARRLAQRPRDAPPVDHDPPPTSEQPRLDGLPPPDG